jgi:hypothetical protein
MRLAVDKALNSLLMRKKEIILVGAALVLGVIYIHFFTHWFDKRQIGITVSIRPTRRMGGTVYPVFFSMNDAYKITSLKVVPLENNEVKTGAVPVWNLVTESNSVPTRAFRYGQKIPGMKPALDGVRPDPLVPGTQYRLFLSTRDAGCQIDFHTQTIGQ